MQRIMTFAEGIPADFFWINQPPEVLLGKGLQIRTAGATDFWQRTHYGFQPDNGHALLSEVEEDTSLSTCVSFQPCSRYDQCGLILRLDSENWVKVSVEYENPLTARLGSVVTNLGYSDWATTDISAGINHIWYRLQTRGADFLLENSFDGREWRQMRIGHLHQPFTAVQIGVYACSPLAGDGFWCTFQEIVIGNSTWTLDH